MTQDHIEDVRDMVYGQIEYSAYRSCEEICAMCQCIRRSLGQKIRLLKEKGPLYGTKRR